MARWLRRVALGLVAVGAVLALLVLGAGRAGLLQGTPPTNLGVRDGRLAAPSTTPNSVSSQARLWAGHPQQQGAFIEPLAQRGSGAETIVRLRRLIEATPGAEIVEVRPDYLRVQFTTPVLRFVDDAEFWADPGAAVVQVRSASRIGRRDMGVNRGRIEALRAALAAGG